MNKNKKRFNNFSKEYLNKKQYIVKNETTILTFLLDNVKGESRNTIKGYLSHHLVSVNGSMVSQFDYPLVKNDLVIISSKPLTNIHKKSDLEIVYEDDEIIVINKPSGLLTIASDKEKGKTAYRKASDYLSSKNKKIRPYVVHRLDEDTSGVLMMVKNLNLQELFQQKWNDLVLDRGYVAIVEGQLKIKKGTIKSYLKSNSLNLMYSSDDKIHGKLAITHYEVKKENEEYSWVDVHIDSGRKNQIRVHMGDLNHHVIGDDKYGNPKNPLKRLGLHAYRLIIKHPINNKIMTFETKIPKEFNNLFKK